MRPNSLTISRRGFLVLCASPALAQEADFSTGVRVVNVFVTVRDKDRGLVRGLTRGDFELSEDGRRREIRYFAAQSDLPLTLGLLFDASGSQRTVIDEQRSASQTFLDQLLRPGDESFAISFNRAVQRVRSLNDLQVPRETDGKLAPQAEGTALFDAIVLAAREALAHTGRKAAVILSDGVDTTSQTKLEAAIEAAQRADLMLYPIRFYDQDVFAFNVSSAATSALREGKRVLERLARETGGGYFEVAGQETLEANYRRIGEELRNQYSLGFTPEPRRPGYQKLRVEVKKRGVSVQARDGYYAQ